MANAHDQQVKEIDAWDSNAKPVSTMWRCLLSEKPLCSGVWGGVVRWEIPLDERNVVRALYSPPLSKYIVFIFFSKTFQQWF